MNKVILAFVFCVFHFSLSAQEILNFELREEEDKTYVMGNGFDAIRAYRAANEDLSFSNQKESMVKIFGGKRMTFIGTVSQENTFNRKTKKYVDGFIIDDLLSFFRFEARQSAPRDIGRFADGFHNVVNDKPLSLAGMRKTTRSIFLKSVDAANPRSLLEIEDYFREICLSEMTLKEREDLFHASIVVEERVSQEGYRSGTIIVDSDTPEYFECVVKVTGNFEFDGNSFYLTNWTFEAY